MADQPTEGRVDELDMPRQQIVLTLVCALAPVAMQEGRHAAAVVKDSLEGHPPRGFDYLDKGNLATIGRVRAVADIKGIQLSGFIAWATWLTVHLLYLIGFREPAARADPVGVRLRYTRAGGTADRR